MNPRLPLVVAHIAEFIRRSFGKEPKPTMNICETFHTIFWGLLPAIVVRLFVMMRLGKFASMLLTKKVGPVVQGISSAWVLVVVVLVTFILYIIKDGWWALLVVLFAVVIGVALLLIVSLMVMVILEYRKEAREEAGEGSRPGKLATVARESALALVFVWRFVVAVKKRLCPIYVNPLYRG